MVCFVFWRQPKTQMQSRKLQVFLSSTYDDLVDERLSAIEAILAAGHIPAAMEQFSPGDDTALERIRKWIDESDAFVLLLGGRYGSIEPTSGRGYVELEYDYALQNKKPLFALVVSKEHHDRRVREFGLRVDEREQPEKYNEFRTTVTRRLCRFWNDKKDIKGAILQTLPELALKHDLTGWVRRDASTQPQLLYDFKQVSGSFGAIDEWYDRTEEEVRISGNDCKTAVEARSRKVKDLLDRGVKVKAMCVNPASPAADMLRLIDPRFPSLELLRSSASAVKGVMEYFCSNYPALFEYRYLPILPAFGLFVTDPERPTGFMKVELYAAQPWAPVGSRPNIVIPWTDTQWRRFFLQQWDNYWEIADPNHPETSEYWKARQRATSKRSGQ